MRILFFSHYFPPERNAPASRTFAHCREWAAAGHAVTVVTCAPHHPRGVLYPGHRNALRHIEYVDGIRVVRCLTLPAANEGTWKRSASFLFYLVSAVCCAMLEERPDIVIATSPQFFCGWAGVVAGTLRRRPVLIEIRDLWPESIAAVGALHARLVLKVLEAMERGMYRAASHIVTLGDGYRDGLIQRGVAAERISVVMNGVDGDLFLPAEPDRQLADRLGVAGRFCITYCGTIGLAHGLEVVLRAARLLLERGRSDIVFLLVGDGARLDALRGDAARAGLDNVMFAGALDRSAIPAVLSVSDACLVHLRKAGTFSTVMPSKIFESAAMERPIILGVQGFARDFIARAGCGICVEPENEEELVAAALQLADDAALRNRLGAAGRAYVTERFDRSRLAERYLGIIERVVDGAGRRTA
ncbi:MAG: glycosyltransferase family 4 protein [Spirochaetaceae bacterium]|nr:glycosyltransferase family 4 protein [Spirochaetaceae bacterium]